MQRLPFVRRLVAHPRTIHECVAEEGIDFMWFVTAPGQVVDVPYLTIVWDLQHRSHPWFPEVSASGQWEHRESVYKAVLGRASVVIVGTETGKQEVTRFFGVPPERVAILPHPTPRFALDASSGSEDAVTKYGLSHPFILYPAQFWPHKNHVNLLLALDHLRRDFDLTVDLALVGSDQGNRHHVERWIERLQLERQVHVLGFVDQSDLIALYRSALALTYVSFCGPENLPPLEAFALGCPVIAADLPGSREQLANAAILVPPDEPKKIADAIKRSMDPGKRQELIDRGKARASRFTARDFVDGALTLIGRFEPIRRVWGQFG